MSLRSRLKALERVRVEGCRACVGSRRLVVRYGEGMGSPTDAREVNPESRFCEVCGREIDVVELVISCAAARAPASAGRTGPIGRAG